MLSVWSFRAAPLSSNLKDQRPLKLKGRIHFIAGPAFLIMVAARCCKSCADFGIREPARQRSVAGVPHRCCDVGSGFVEHEFDECTRVEIDDGHLQPRCSLTMSATDRFGFGRDPPPAIGRVDRAGRLITPSAVRRSSTEVESSATIRATGVPRSVMTTSLPSRAASIHRPRWALSSVTATSTNKSVHQGERRNVQNLA